MQRATKALKWVGFRTRIAHNYKLHYCEAWYSLGSFHSSSANTKIGQRLLCPTFKKPFTIGKDRWLTELLTDELLLQLHTSTSRSILDVDTANFNPAQVN